MRTRDAEQHYRQRVARVVAFIVAHPMQAHALEDLAALAHFSPFHFHRVYLSVTGETVAATVRRVRLALATHLLAQGQQSITQVALTVGYESPPSFSRAFGQFVGESPRDFQRRMQQTLLPTGAGAGTPNATPPPQAQVVQRPAQKVYALRHHGPLATIPHTQRRLQRHLGARAMPSHWLGASYGDPDDPVNFRYYAAAALPEPWPAVDSHAGFEVFEIPAGRYAQHRLSGPYTRISATVGALYQSWLPGSGYEPDDRPMLEHYLNSPGEVAPAELLTDLLLPIRSASPP